MMYEVKVRDLIQYRTVWMLLGIISIVIFHANVGSSNPFFSPLVLFGYGGVDIFLFASGIGCYYSYMSDRKPWEFVKRRIKKIMPTYALFMFFWGGWKILVGSMPQTALLGNFLCVQYITGKGYYFNWYVSAMWIFYLVTPVIAELVSEITRKEQIIAFFLFLFALSVPFWNAHTAIIIVSRIPIFCLGCVVARADDWRISKQIIVGLIVVCLIGMGSLGAAYAYEYDRLWDYGLYWYPFFAIVPGLCLSISLGCRCIEKSKVGTIIVSFMKHLGKFTFEVFLIHIMVFEIYNMLVENKIIRDCMWYKIALIFPVILGSWLLNHMVCVFVQLWKKRCVFSERKG